MSEILFYGADWCSDCQRSKAWLKENNIEYKFVDSDENEWVGPIIEKLNNGKRRIPTIIINKETVLIEPTNKELEAAVRAANR